MTQKKVRVTIQEIRQPEQDAYLVARSVAEQLEKRVAFRRAMKQAVGRAMRFGAKGVRVQVSGRLGGSEMSRRESDRDGRVPLHTLRADIDFGIAEAHTTYGVIGVKVWIYRGEILPPGREPAAGTVSGRPVGRPAGRPATPLDGGSAGAPAQTAVPTAPTAAAPIAPVAPAAPPAQVAPVAPPAQPAPAAPSAEPGTASAAAVERPQPASEPESVAELDEPSSGAATGEPAGDLTSRRAPAAGAVTPESEAKAESVAEAGTTAAKRSRTPRSSNLASDPAGEVAEPTEPSEAPTAPTEDA
jgi:small subunit ribosomal protein S3